MRSPVSCGSDPSTTSLLGLFASTAKTSLCLCPAFSGIDVIAVLESFQFVPDSWLGALKSAPQAGNAAVAYALYKASEQNEREYPSFTELLLKPTKYIFVLQLVSPIRYMVTIAGTHVTMKVLSRMGLIPTARQVRTQVKGYVEEKREKVREKREDVKEKVREKADDMKDRWLDLTDKFKESSSNTDPHAPAKKSQENKSD